MNRSLVAFLPLLLLIAPGCSKDSGPGPIKGYESYTDRYLKFAVRYPSGWATATQSGTAIFYSSPTLADAFGNYEPGEQTGAKIEVRCILGGADGMKGSMDTLMETFNDKEIFKTDEVDLAGVKATRLSYGFPVGESHFKAERYYVVNGNVVTYLETAVFGDYAAYAAVFDTVKKSFKPGEVAAVASAGTDTSGKVTEVDLVAPPAAETRSYSNAHFALSHPANFNSMTASGGKLASVKFIGDRVDSYVQVDVSESTNDLQSHADAIKPRFGAGSKTTLGGQPAFVFNFKGGSSASGRIYLTKAGNKLYQMTVTWYTPQADLYLPAYDKVIASFKAR